MRDLERLSRAYGGHTPNLLGATRNSAVLCPLIEEEDGLGLLFEVRSRQVSQGGEACFPGGRMEPEETPVQCALRETEEELAIPPGEISILGTPDFICSQRGFLLQPVLGLVSPAGLKALSPAPAEVEAVFTVPLEFFRSQEPEVYSYELVPRPPEGFPYEAVGVSANYPWAHGWVEIPVWTYQGRAVWGMTARIVRDLVRVLQETP